MPTDHRVRIRVPATSANLGSGLDTLGLALGLYNEVTIRATPAGADVTIRGEGAGRFAAGEGNLVVRSARAAMRELGASAPGLAMHCVNRIPSARGLGSSAACIVAGVVAGAVLAQDRAHHPQRRGRHDDDIGGPAGDPADDHTGRPARDAVDDHTGRSTRDAVDDHTVPPTPDQPVDKLTAADDLAGIDLDWALDLCARLEGHPDNVAACLLGGLTVAWYEPDGRARAVRTPPAADLVAVALIPAVRVSTADARKLLPARVALADATHAAGRAALAVLALSTNPTLLLPATEDRLHQAHRAPAMPESVALVGRLRAAGLAATISGAGPSVLVLGGGSPAALLDAVSAVGAGGYDVRALAPVATGAVVSAR